MSEETIERIVDGERFEFPAHNLHEFNFWFGTDNPFGTPMYSRLTDKFGNVTVGVTEDTGMCGKDAIVTRWTALAVVMQNKCNATHLGRTDEKRDLLRFGKKRGRRPRKTPA